VCGTPCHHTFEWKNCRHFKKSLKCHMCRLLSIMAHWLTAFVCLRISFSCLRTWLLYCRMATATVESCRCKPNYRCRPTDGHHRRLHVWVQVVRCAVDQYRWLWLESAVHVDWHFRQREEPPQVWHCTSQVYRWLLQLSIFTKER